MTPAFHIHQADVIAGLRGLAAGSVHCAVTSPPYWGLRSYFSEGTAEHTQQGGLEDSPDAHVAWVVAWMRELRRVLRDDGTVWLNYGDCYAASTTAPHARGKAGGPENPPRVKPSDGLKPKDLVLMPARIALALQADGWIVRGRYPWVKRNGMPESVTDRPSTGHEELLLLAKRPHYFYDAEAVRGDYAPATIARADDSALADGKTANTVGFKRTISHSGRARKSGDWWVESVRELARFHEAEGARLRADSPSSPPDAPRRAQCDGSGRVESPNAQFTRGCNWHFDPPGCHACRPWAFCGGTGVLTHPDPLELETVGGAGWVANPSQFRWERPCTGCVDCIGKENPGRAAREGGGK